MKNGKTLTYEALQQEAKRLMNESDWTQVALSIELGFKSPKTISTALYGKDNRRIKALVKLVEYLSPVEIEVDKAPRFYVRKKQIQTEK